MSYRPPLSLPDVPKIIKDLYGINIRVVKELDSYDDRNVLVEMDDDSPLPPRILQKADVKGSTRFLLKVCHEDFSRRPDILDLKNMLITHLTNAEFPCPALIRTLEGTYQTVIKLTDSKTGKEGQYVAKLFDFHAGITLDKVCLTRSLCRQLGKLTGWMDTIFMDFPVKDHKEIDEMKIIWNMVELPLVRTKFHVFKDKSKIPFLEKIISKFEADILNSQESFSKGVIHSDINDGNALVLKKLTDKSDCVKGKSSCSECVEGSSYEITSIIDFGDLTYSLHLFNLAISMAYMMLNKDGLDPLEAGAAVLAGYQEHYALPERELKHLFTCIRARFVQSYVYGQVAMADDEENAEYTQTHAGRCLPMLEYLEKFSDAEFLEHIMKLR